MARRIAIPHGIQALILIELTKRAGRWVDEDTLIYAVDHVLDGRESQGTIWEVASDMASRGIIEDREREHDAGGSFDYWYRLREARRG